MFTVRPNNPPALQLEERSKCKQRVIAYYRLRPSYLKDLKFFWWLLQPLHRIGICILQCFGSKPFPQISIRTISSATESIDTANTLSEHGNYYVRYNEQDWVPDPDLLWKASNGNWLHVDLLVPHSDSESEQQALQRKLEKTISSAIVRYGLRQAPLSFVLHYFVGVFVLWVLCLILPYLLQSHLNKIQYAWLNLLKAHIPCLAPSFLLLIWSAIIIKGTSLVKNDFFFAIQQDALLYHYFNYVHFPEELKAALLSAPYLDESFQEMRSYFLNLALLVLTAMGIPVILHQLFFSVIVQTLQ